MSGSDTLSISLKRVLVNERSNCHPSCLCNDGLSSDIVNFGRFI